MKFSRGGSVYLLLAILASTVPAAAQSVAWWKSEPFQKEVGLSPDQCTRIDTIFQTAIPSLRQTKQELDRQETELSKLIEANADEATVMRQVDRVETTRAALNKTRTAMLLHMRQVLTPDQRVRFKTAHEQWEKDHPRDSRATQPGNRRK